MAQDFLKVADTEGMVGESIAREFEGVGIVEGIVEFAHALKDFTVVYRVRYSDGDTEDLDLEEVQECLTRNQPDDASSAAEEEGGNEHDQPSDADGETSTDAAIDSFKEYLDDVMQAHESRAMLNLQVNQFDGSAAEGASSSAKGSQSGFEAIPAGQMARLLTKILKLRSIDALHRMGVDDLDRLMHVLDTQVQNAVSLDLFKLEPAQVKSSLVTLQGGSDAAVMALAIMTASGISSRLVSDELIVACTQLIKQHLVRHVTPVFAAADAKNLRQSVSLSLRTSQVLAVQLLIAFYVVCYRCRWLRLYLGCVSC
jgi:hypothetical protein